MERADLEDFIARSALGERAAFSDLYDATSAKLLAVCLRILRDRALAEDAMQDAYVKIWENAGRFRVTAHSPMSWLITIARNTAIDRLRARRSHGSLSPYEESLPAPGPTPEHAAIAASEARRLTSCLDELPSDRRAALVGAYLQGEVYTELAARFDVPLNTMRTWLRRGLISLRECMSR